MLVDSDCELDLLDEESGVAGDENTDVLGSEGIKVSHKRTRNFGVRL